MRRLRVIFDGGCAITSRTWRGEHKAVRYDTSIRHLLVCLIVCSLVLILAAKSLSLEQLVIERVLLDIRLPLFAFALVVQIVQMRVKDVADRARR